MNDNGLFTRLMDEYGSLEQEDEQEKTERRKEDVVDPIEAIDKSANAALMQEEERNTGAVGWETYTKYLKFAGGVWWAPFFIALLTIAQAAQGKPIHVTALTSIQCYNSSREQLVLGFLDISKYLRIRSSAIHGRIRWFRCVLLSLYIHQTPTIFIDRCCSSRLHVYTEFLLRVKRVLLIMVESLISLFS